MDTPVRDQQSVLLIEENDTILDSLADWLSMTFPDVRLIETTDYDQGILLNRSESPDVVLMDISGLGKAGAESVRSIKSARPGAAVFALVSLDHDSYQRSIESAGAESCACIWRLRTELLPRLKDLLLPGREERLKSPAH